ncbi:uncharacterized protein LOC115081641 [Rhinatrema bivittatum]|uniref:uncharacterized protein LOC115081641 n=1 Tax=Rhinatrema bivittatum TaxID=194408 RepID=UPI001126B716|nr:uncharacterized protein LOC115081641 [Rhinatrema bivittatum]
MRRKEATEREKMQAEHQKKREEEEEKEKEKEREEEQGKSREPIEILILPNLRPSEMAGSEGAIEMATLGRPFQLGMLYDCRNDSLVPGITLWNIDSLVKDSQPKPESEYQIIASDSTEAKSSALNVSASLEASVLGGLISIKGSAKFMNDKKTSKHQARVTLQYRATTKFEQLTMRDLGAGNVTYPYVFEQGIATHVITGVLYGAQAFFIFDQEVNSSEAYQEIQGSLQATIKMIPLVSISGEAELQLSEKERVNAQKFSCRFYGDFALEKNPVTFQDALAVYANLPKLMGENGENAVPMRAWLYPLNKINTAAARLVQEISVSLVRRARDTLDQLVEYDMQCNDLMKDCDTLPFQAPKKKIQLFKSRCQEYQLVCQKKFCELLPDIRGGGKEESALVDIMKSREESPFCDHTLTEWIEEKDNELTAVKTYLERMKDITILPSKSALTKTVLNPEAKWVVGFMFTSLKKQDPQLESMKTYLSPELGEKEQDKTRKTEAWYHSTDSVQHTAYQFLTFASANKNAEKTKFVVASVLDEINPGASIYLYENGKLSSHKFQPPSKPGRPLVSAKTHDSITLELIPPEYGASWVEKYRIEYKCRETMWVAVDTEALLKEFTMSNLKANFCYDFRCTAASKIGVSLPSEVMASVKTHPTSPPTEVLKHQAEPSSITITWCTPSVIGDGAVISQYWVEFKEFDSGACWNGKHASGRFCQTTLEDLKPGTAYQIRVIAKCGEDGNSLPSIEVMITTPKEGKTLRLAEQLLKESVLLSTGQPSVYNLSLREEKIEESADHRFFRVGDATVSRKNKVIMMVGATGSGKTTLINGLVNYVLGVEWEDNFRFKLINEGSSKSQAESQTSFVAAYQLNYQEGFKVPVSLTIIDTPGFGDTRGIERDKEIMKQIHVFFSKLKYVDHIDAICFLVQASLARLTHSQKYIFDSVLSVFGNDIKDNIQILVTFADRQTPAVLEALLQAQVPCPMNTKGKPIHYKFNNSAIFTNNRKPEKTPNSSEEEDEDDEEEGSRFDKMVWKMGTSSLNKFFAVLDKIESKSLQLTKEVLEERKRLEQLLERLQPDLKAGIAQLEVIKRKKDIVERQRKVLEDNMEDGDKVEEENVKENIDSKCATNCPLCQVSCHFPCELPSDDNTEYCAAMDYSGQCVVCPGKCPWKVHLHQNFMWIIKRRTFKSSAGTENMIEMVQKDVTSKMNELEALEKEYAEAEANVIKKIEESSQCLKRLEKIALKSNPLSTPEYIELLITTEKQEAKPGYEKRIEALLEVKEQAILISKIVNGEKLLPSEEEIYEKNKERLQKIALSFQKRLLVINAWKKHGVKK